jgi:hypothetical protein
VDAEGRPDGEYVGRLLRHMDAHGHRQCVPRNDDPTVRPAPLLDFDAGYVLRSLAQLPKSGSKAPWKLRMNYAPTSCRCASARWTTASCGGARRPGPSGPSRRWRGGLSAAARPRSGGRRCGPAEPERDAGQALGEVPQRPGRREVGGRGRAADERRLPARLEGAGRARRTSPRGGPASPPSPSAARPSRRSGPAAGCPRPSPRSAGGWPCGAGGSSRPSPGARPMARTGEPSPSRRRWSSSVNSRLASLDCP